MSASPFDLDVRVGKGGDDSASPDTFTALTRLVCTRITCRCSRYSCITQCPVSC